MTATRQIRRQMAKPTRSVHYTDLNDSQRQWLNRVRINPEPETTSVLFSKSISDVARKPSTSVAIRAPSYRKAQVNSRSMSPQKLVGRTKAVPIEITSTLRNRKSPSPAKLIRSDQQYKSTIKIPSCESLEKPRRRRSRRPPSPSSSLPMSSADSLSSSSSDSDDSSNRKFAHSMPSVAAFGLRKVDNREAPKVRMRPNRNNGNTKNSAYRHTIRIGDEEANELFNNNCVQNGMAIKCTMHLTGVSTASPNSSESSCSIDSGQCSGRVSCLAHKVTKQMSESTASSDFSSHLKSALPSYARMAISMDHVLRTASTIYSLLDSNLDDSKVTRELVHKVQIYMQIVKQSACQPFLIDEDFTLVTSTMQQLTNCSLDYKDQKFLELLDYSSVVVRRMLEQSLIIFLRITATYLNDCTNKDRLLPIALEHLVHLLLFSDEFCLEAIRCKSIENIITFCRQQNTSNGTLRLLLRVLAVLCGVSRGCVQLLSIGGLDLVIHLFNTKPTDCAVEAAGVLAQLTNPNHPFIRLGVLQIETIIVRLLELVDESRNPESLLLASATLANFSLQNAVAVRMLYERNAIQRLVQALNRPDNSTNIFIQEQVVIIFTQLAAHSFDQALVAQDGIPVLLKMLRAGDQQQRFDYARRIRYKAAVCLATVARHSLGLKTIFDNNGLVFLEEILLHENFNQSSTGNSPFLLICANIQKQLKAIYKPLESVV